MQLNDFHYDLPSELIAQYPLPERTASRLLCLNAKTGKLVHDHFINLLDYLLPNDLLVFNDTQVIPARLFARKQTGGQVELLIERILDNKQVLALIKTSKKPKLNERIILANQIEIAVIEKQDDRYLLEFHCHQSVLEILEVFGHIPLPPYMNRTTQLFDEDRYQTVYAAHKGAVAAPTAGLHFDLALLEKIEKKGVYCGSVTLHVGLATFQPVRVTNITEHKMHKEVMLVSPKLCEQVHQTKAQGGRVIAIGTTSVRCLETAARTGEILPYHGETDLFIYPGYSFQCVDALITNFHIPKSTLLMLVCAFGGYENVMNAYKEAVTERYRFFSYGDAMLVL